MIKIKDVLMFVDTLNIEYTFFGDENQEIVGFSSLKNYKENTITWIQSNKRLINDIETVFFAIVEEDIDINIQNIIKTNKSKIIFFSILEEFFDNTTELPEIGHNTYISQDVELGKNVKIGHNCVIDGHIKIGDNTTIWNNVSIVNVVKIGKNCSIQSGTRIGHDGFSRFDNLDGNKRMLRHFGSVLIGDYVHFGMNNVVARGIIDDTIICDNVQVADLTHIGHDNYIGENTTVICSTIYGNCKIGKNVYLAGNLVRNFTQMGDNSFGGMGSLIINDVRENTTVVGVPAKELKKQDF